jgi:16S rRNA (guanine(966)-N(2))-methyltransferase RsmD
VARQAPQEVRIIGGRFKRSPLSVPTWPGLRPTSSRVRETLFNWLGQDLTGWRVLDAFAGSGALGLEAASRGAQSVTMLEREPALARGIEANVRRLGAQGVSVMAADALVWMKQQARRQSGVFDLVLLDPPFEAGLFDEALGAATDCVPPGGWIYLEAPLPCISADSAVGHAGDVLTLPPGLRMHRQGRAGAVHYHLIERVGSPPNAPAPGG